MFPRVADKQIWWHVLFFIPLVAKSIDNHISALIIIYTVIAKALFSRVWL